MRVSLKRALRYILVTAMIVFGLLNLHVLYSAPPAGEQQSMPLLQMPLVTESRAKNGNPINQHNDGDNHVQHSINQVKTTSKLSVAILPKTISGTENVITNGNNATKFSHHNIINASDLEALKLEVARINSEQYVHNLDKFGLRLGAESLVIIIQTHDRPDYLRILLDSMRKVRDIEKTLLIISHDIYSPQLNSLVESVDFCPVMQIFFPFSQQIFKNEFPGEHPNDCPRNVKKNEARNMKCNNAEHPDKYGHYREAKYCQAKHHWIWKLQHVFEDIHLLQGYEGNVMLLEDDYFLSEDIIFSTHMLRGLRERDCPQCQMLVLGNYDKNQNYAINSAKVERAYWISSKHNMGMTFNRSLWESIKKCAKEFCLFDDYNWDWTLQHISLKCIPDKVRLLVMKASRIFHIGECGMHKKSKNCDPKAKVKEVEVQLANNHKHLYPNMVSVAGDSRLKLRDPKPNGGWGDKRDHALCLRYFNITTPS